jgi:crossover junction endodeoxyribonuclease RusA
VSETMSQADVRTLMAGGHVPSRKPKRTCQRLEVTLPIPPAATRPNARGHWAKKAKAVKQQREDAAVGARLALIDGGYKAPHWERATVEVTLYRSASNARRSDSDNIIAWCKALYDGLQDAGVILNDRGLTHLPPRQFLGKEAGGENKMVVKIESHAPGPDAGC